MDSEADDPLRRINPRERESSLLRRSPAKVRSVAMVSGSTLPARIEQAFQKQPKWTTTDLMSAIGVKYRSNLWKALKGLVKEGKLHISKQGGRRQPAEYTRVTR
jgi:hypothetical protein